MGCEPAHTPPFFLVKVIMGYYKFETFEEMFLIVWEAVGKMNQRQRQKYRKTMLTIRDQDRQNISPSLYQQDLVYKYYGEIFDQKEEE